MTILGVLPENLLYGIIAIALVWLILHTMFKYGNKIRERREIIKAGTSFWGIKRGLSKDKEKEKKLEASEQAEGKLITKMTGYGPAKKAGGAVEKAGEAEAELEQATTELARTTEAIIADLQNTTNEIVKEAKEKLLMENAGKKEFSTIEALEIKIRELDKFDHIDQATAQYLHQYFQALVNHLDKQTGYEEQNEEHQKGFIKHLKQSTKDLLPISRHAKKNLRTLGRKEEREKKAFRTEFVRLRAAIWKKRARLMVEILKGRKADPVLKEKLREEISLLKKNGKELKKIKDQLVKAHQTLDLEIKQLKETMKNVVRIARSQKRYSRTLGKKEKELGKRLSKIKKEQGKLKQAIKKFSGEEKVHGLVLAFSEHLNNYFEFYVQLIKEDLTFEEKLREIAMQNIMIEKKMLAFIKLLESIEESEKAIEQGTAAIINIVATIMTADVSQSLRGEATNLQAASGVLEDEKRMENKLAALNQEIEQRTMFAVNRLDKLIVEEKKAIIENEALHKQEASHLANSIGTMMNRKITIDETYMGKAKKFGEQLEKTNEEAGAAYKEAMKTTAYQQAA